MAHTSKPTIGDALAPTVDATTELQKQFARSGTFPPYVVVSKWCGWFGGFGSERDLAEYLYVSGYHLVTFEARRSLWWWMIPRIKVLIVLEDDDLRDR